jgi:[ribosomal protein S5]-alanine N-acetyltransferase
MRDPTPADVSIRTERLELRPFVHADADALVTEADDPRVASTLRDAFPSPYTHDDARAWIALSRVHPHYGLAIVKAGRPIGGIGLELQVDERRFDADLGYWLGVAHWGQGFASEAVAAFCAHAFATTDLQRLHAYVYESNPASGRVLEKCGFVVEGVSRRAIFKQGRFLDCRLYGRLKE